MNAVVSVAHAYNQDAFEKAGQTLFAKRFKACGSDAQSYLQQVWSDALADDMSGLSMDDALALAAEFWAYAAERPGEKIKVRVRCAQGADGRELDRDILEVIGQDRPFLVDSVMGEIAGMGLDVLAMFHPIVQVRRDSDANRVGSGGRVIKESMIQVHVDRLSPESRARLEQEIMAALIDLRDAVDDWQGMLDQMDEVIGHIASAPTSAPKDELEESLAFLRWLREGHFTFLGCRDYRYIVGPDGKLERKEPDIVPDSGHGVLRDPDRNVLRSTAEPLLLSPAIEAYLRAPSPVIVAKSNMKSRVHRRVYMDYIGVKRYRSDGSVIGETRFVGLFTSDAYDQMAREVPLIRRKVRRVIERSGKPAGSHSYKKLQNIVENYPRDELFQTEEDDLLQLALGILHLNDRPRTKLFMRRDQFDRFVSCLLFVPRERYNSKVREQAGELIREAFNGRLSAFYPNFGDGPLARVHFIIGLDPFKHPEPDPAELERQVAELARTWEDELNAAARAASDTALRRAALNYLDGYSAGYRERYNAAEALADIQRMETISADRPLAARAFNAPGEGAGRMRLKLYRHGEQVALSEVLPVLENLGLHVQAESGYAVRRKREGEDAETLWVHEFEARLTTGAIKDAASAAEPFEAALLAVLSGQAEDDGFNRLVLAIGVTWRQAAFLRACARYRQQSGLDPSQSLQEEAFAAHPDIARGLLSLAETRFDPALELDLKAREAKAKSIAQELRVQLDAVESLDHDRALRRILRLIEAVLRTNFYQTDEHGAPKPWISLKIASRKLRDLPEPKPYREIFVWSPRVEGVHIRFGPVARGGLRWSDRREDFRTEVLGLVKAQQVKNAVIVPVGSKGGFYAKQLPDRSDREAWLAEGQEAYKVFLRGLLDITDNLSEDAVKRPGNVVCWDDEDPYLVVAADKGTATFSDMANTVAQSEYDFWLGDAFASGGSAGYDHKKMGITARGAWVSVQRHFREMGKDIQTEPFTVIGVGDMSGDVFGNGMLLSKQIRLLAAFDHRDIFIDPDPADPAVSWAERERLFKLPRSSWQDYDASLISKGGGVFSRSAKAITLNDAIRALTGLEGKTATPNELMRALLKAEAELIWFGGIGTYVKASQEQDYEVGDRANDPIRINGAELKAAVIGEGANLGLTQAARIEYARSGGRCNADFVDNSAGVDSSDHEVNIKILLNPMVRDGQMDLKARNALLESMTDAVAEHVLAHNYDQSLALTIAREHAAEDIDAHERLMDRLERAGRLDRKVEGLPSAEQIRELKEQGLGLTRPEIAVLISYAKITLFDEIVASGAPDDPHFTDMLVTYFPHQLARHGEAMQGHRLKREIIATRLANDMVNLGGPTFLSRAIESTGASADAIARAFEAGRRIFRFKDFTDRINALDNQAPASVQTALHDEVIRLLRRQTYWLARRAMGGEAVPVADVIAAYQPGVDALKAMADDVISPFDADGVAHRMAGYAEQGAPEDLARDVARLKPLTSSSDVIDLAREASWPLAAAACLYHAVGARFRFDVLRGAGGQLSSSLHWDRLAMRRLIEDLYASQYALTHQIMAYAGEAGGSLAAGVESPDRNWAGELVASWTSRHDAEVDRADRTLEELGSSGVWALSKVAIASTQLRELATPQTGS
ncbi:NAD-glutamate dehydrogenase [Alkalicaulis satelles]|uniref:NAD-glutamate dehydrogenase n=1 Tax=Alkalicaulis satelles TaxID=2609175 RepID=A0A5M6ZJX6_9PROT|nr:NAD-glutamate dehydrogenase [Alkalicaulis satelles]KAA5803967.1 NAD-glutamate dehydrogenase [Alkalicaulis satelles]